MQILYFRKYFEKYFLKYKIYILEKISKYIFEKYLLKFIFILRIFVEF